ncbi:MAG: aminopeptidase P family protein [Oscillatoriales cyanobacterium C42_A2020_001]|nr:aminopeptidase P family protein [Leptolyngbyaceae cyanobacterium C42_A2020_001]
MQALDGTMTLIETVRSRRQRLAELIDFPVVLWSGSTSSRNFPANTFPFRASSHFLYFAGLPLENAAIQLEHGKITLFMDQPSPASALWHGESATPEAIAEMMGADVVYPLSELQTFAAGCATIPVQDARTSQQQTQVLNRVITNELQGRDRELAEAIITLRLTHDGAALVELRKAAAISVQAHKAGMAATRTAKTEADVRAAMEAVMIAHNATPAYSSIVTVHGEVLHNDRYHHPLHAGDLLLADVGAEVGSGWAADITRTWAVSGKFSPTQRAIYEVVLASHDACIAAMYPGVEYRDIHLLACRVIAEGLVDLGILQGEPADLVDMDAHALFFPHGVGHLLGLDVHDMEDLGDVAGYATGRTRSDRFGLGYLRLDRPLQVGMLVTIEPGFYQVPAILNDPSRREKYRNVVNWERLTDFSDVRGIRIEDDVLITETGTDVLTQDLPTAIADIELLIQPRNT